MKTEYGILYIKLSKIVSTLLKTLDIRVLVCNWDVYSTYSDPEVSRCLGVDDIIVVDCMCMC